MYTTLKPGRFVVVLAMGCALISRTGAAETAVPADVPPGADTLLIRPGETVTRRLHITVADSADGQHPVLSFLGRLETPSTGGANTALKILLDGVPLTSPAFRPRLLGKPMQFTPSDLSFPLSWYAPAAQAWLLVTGPDFAGTWTGTGCDYDFRFDLSGLTGRTALVEVGLQNVMPPANAAPIVISGLAIATVTSAELDRLRGAVSAAPRPAVVRAEVPPGETAEPQAYEVQQSGRGELRPAQVSFADLTGWRLEVVGDARVSLQAAVTRRLWQAQTARFSYAGGTAETTVAIYPPQPVRLTEPFDAAQLLLYGDYDRSRDRGLSIELLLEDEGGREFTMDLGVSKEGYWELKHGILAAEDGSRIRFPVHFKALVLGHCNVEGERQTYLESLAFYKQDRRPARRLHLEHPISPVTEDGMLPVPPAGVQNEVELAGDGAVLTSVAAGHRLEFRIRPRDGGLDAVTARWDDGEPFLPMAGAGLKLDLPGGERVPAAAEVVLQRSAREGDRFVVVRRCGEVEWQESYWIKGRTLGVDLACPGGQAVGTAFGLIKGLRNPTGIEVPYLLIANKPGPWIACGSGLFVSVLPDWYHSDFSALDDRVVAPTADTIGVWTGTSYLPLTDGRRNGLRDRLLVTVSAEFADTLPSHQNPPSPNRASLAPYLYFVENTLLENFLTTLHRYGVDHVIANPFASPFTADLQENFVARWRLHPSLSSARYRAYRKLVKEDLGYRLGTYVDLNHLSPVSEYFDENLIALRADRRWTSYWFGAYQIKDIALPGLARAVGQKIHARYRVDNAYMDEHTLHGPYALDYEAGAEGAGVARVQVQAEADCLVESRRWYGTTCSEGYYRWLYAGLVDMDYATIPASHAGHPACDFPLLVDFDLLRIHPFAHGTMMSYAPGNFLGETSAAKREVYADDGRGVAPLGFYQYLAASLAYGHMLMAGYGYIPRLSRFIELYALMQGVQREYLTDRAVEISYHDGTDYLPTSQAVAAGSYVLGRVCVRYSRGLRVRVNYNPTMPWTVSVEGREYLLPPFGWVADKPGEILAFSALLNGQRVSYTSCPEYIYLNSGATVAQVAGLEVDGAVWLKRERRAIRLIPCGDLAAWDVFEPADLLRRPGRPATALPFWDLRQAQPPADRGCRRIVVDCEALLGKPASAVRIRAHDSAGQRTAPTLRRLDATRLQVLPDATTLDYLLD
jgi:hypothetical protein